MATPRKIVKHELVLEEDHAGLSVKLDNGIEIYVAITPDSIGNVYETIRYKREGTTKWEEIVSCKEDSIHRMIQRGLRHSI